MNSIILYSLDNFVFISVLFAYATTVLGYIWLVAISLIFLLIALYKCFQDRYIAKKSAVNNTGEIINNDESKLYEGGQSGIVNDKAVSFPLSKKRNHRQVEEKCDGWRYQNDFRNGQCYHDSSFIDEVNILNLKQTQLCQAITQNMFSYYTTLNNYRTQIFQNQCSDERYRYEHSYSLREDRTLNEDIRRWQVYNKGNWHSKGNLMEFKLH